MKPLGFFIAFAIGVLVAAGPAVEQNIIRLRHGVNSFALDKTKTWRMAERMELSAKLPRQGEVLLGTHQRIRQIAITFDDGPHPENTPQLVALLKRFHVPATFFLVGKMVDQYPYLAKLEVENGFEVGNHSYSHTCMTKLSRLESLTELRADNLAIFRACGKWPHYFRPPGGDADPRTVREAAANGLAVTMWSDDPGDYQVTSPKVVIERTLRGLSDGGIILLHDGGPATLQALPTLIRDIRKRGYRFVPLKDLIKTRVR